MKQKAPKSPKSPTPTNAVKWRFAPDKLTREMLEKRDQATRDQAINAALKSLVIEHGKRTAATDHSKLIHATVKEYDWVDCLATYLNGETAKINGLAKIDDKWVDLRITIHEGEVSVVKNPYDKSWQAIESLLRIHELRTTIGGDGSNDADTYREFMETVLYGGK